MQSTSGYKVGEITKNMAKNRSYLFTDFKLHSIGFPGSLITNLKSIFWKAKWQILNGGHFFEKPIQF